MAAPAVYRVPRRFITFPDDPRPYGILAVSFLGHMLCLAGALALSAFLGARLDQSKVYIVNLVPATPSFGSPTPADPPAPTTRAPEAPRPKPRYPLVGLLRIRRFLSDRLMDRMMLRQVGLTAGAA